MALHRLCHELETTSHLLAAEARAQQVSQKARLEKSQKDLDRVTELQQKGLAAAAEVDAMRTEAAKHGAAVFAPTPRLATDNAAMIGAAGLFRLERGERSDAGLNAFSALGIPGLQTED